jgi:branched-subunit amino acid transport protein
MRRLRSGWAVHGAASVAYLLLAVFLWWGVWSTHPTSTATCGCGDTSILTWFMAWPAYALHHGDPLFFSNRVVHPYGVNLPANTSFLALSLPLTPVTWLAGPVAALNVAATLAPVAGALSARGLLLRWGTWGPAAFVAGLFFGFSPFVLENLALQHVEFATLVVPPLLLLCLDELLVRQRGQAWTWGLALAALCAVQFFVSAEVLVMCVLAGVIGTLYLTVATLVRSPDQVVRRWRHATAGLGVAGGSAVVVLAYPAWYAVAGPRSLPHRVWPDVQYFGSAWRTLFLPADARDRGPNTILETYGYFGAHPLLLGYLGIGMTATIVIGLAWFRRDGRLWFFSALLVTLEALSLGAAAWPWRLLDHLPVVVNIVPDRLAAVADLCAAVLLGLVMDRAHRSGLRWPERVGMRRPSPGTVAALGLAALALVPIVATERLPFTTRSVDVPRWFATVGTRVPSSDVVLTYPFASSGLRAPMTWQAVGSLRYSLVGGGTITPDPPLHPTPAQRIDAAATVDLINLSDGFLPLPTGTTAESARLRHAFHSWGVTTIVIPSEAGWPPALQGRSVPVAVATMTVALGFAPVHRADAWVWAVPRDPAPPRVLDATAFVGCTTSAAADADPGTAATCVLDRSTPMSR